MINELFNIREKVVIITGASEGIGKEISLFLSKLGAHVVLIARNEKKLALLAQEIKDNEGKVTIKPYDLNNIHGIKDLIADIYEECKSVDVLINNAGINIAKPIEELQIEDWEKVMQLNVTSMAFLCQAVGEYMKLNNYGKIINMSSQMGFVGYYKRSLYSASKGAVNQLTKALAIEWAEHKINVNGIAPTFIETKLTEKMFEDSKFRSEVMDRIPLGRLAKCEDLLGAILLLSTKSSDMITGQTLLIDGGWTVW
ncbi:SDR family NAD(P)-dependent oxidoreductase [Lysinibacillus endophyticus]|uniref:SDR family NAD(P)-dependent oxidoreductase n=1 Tax=Ureibacillus endophyticus TaxID=1978490 RepID=UPI0020A186E3|nr:SDR family oxidoreductase [Lysinibacillus endophyticus]MCP1146784.1 SDR family oxidoreductase [Lysinibacillus endophyticus]